MYKEVYYLNKKTKILVLSSKILQKANRQYNFKVLYQLTMKQKEWGHHYWSENPVIIDNQPSGGDQPECINRII